MKIINAYFPYNNKFIKGTIVVENHKIKEILKNSLFENDGDMIVDAAGRYLLPGFIDMHIHGRGGFDMMDGKIDSVLKIAEQLPQTGVTSFLATTYANSNKNITASLTSIKKAKNQQKSGSIILGAHLEGPYINVEAKGAQLEKFIRPANSDEYAKWLNLGIISEVTVAPEIKENEEFIKKCAMGNIVVSIGHSNASYDEVDIAVKLGARQVTHTFNGMKGINHRYPGTAGASLVQDKLYCEVIADLFHIHPAVIKLIILAKGVDKVILITDSVSAAGLPNGEYNVLNHKVCINNGKITDKSGSLCGSSLTMDLALRNVILATGKQLEELWKITSCNAAKQLKIKKGEIKAGYDADFVLLDKDYKVDMTVISGKIVYQIKK